MVATSRSGSFTSLMAVVRHSLDALSRSEEYFYRKALFAVQNSASSSFSFPVTSASFELGRK